VRLITDSAPGSAIDVPVRIIAEGLSRIWGQQAVVINQPGAGGAIAARTAATAAPDGYTFGIAASAFVALLGTADNLPVQVPRDFAPVGYLGGALMYVAAAPWLEVKTLPELIALAKEKPGEVLWLQRHRPLEASDRRIAATPSRHQIGLMAPAGTPVAIVRKANADLIKAMHDPDIRKRLADLGRDDRPIAPADLYAFIDSEQQK
jgi:tripartite-type tricarboxylate transporter receptor subunit TctC